MKDNAFSLANVIPRWRRYDSRVYGEAGVLDLA
jgi:hypothetical protein